ncbi:DUF125-domain-containing protein [Auricularia subglabra TFB-10046 SS5]|nr:DUF125-domain-containing protein [Auricularia subglabra TFB-10046 SS5]
MSATSTIPHDAHGAARSVRLPSRDASALAHKAPVWPLESSESAPAPLNARCGANNGICCKELKGEDERTLVDPDIVRDIVIGLSDGLTVPFALTAGLSSLGESRLVVLGGVAELIAGAISMGIGGFLASQAERDHFRYQRAQTAARVLRSCDGEMQREVHAVLGPVGIDEQLSTKIALKLREVEMDARGVRPGTRVSTITDTEAGQLRWAADVGLTAFLLKFGEGIEEVPNRRMYASAFTIGMGYLLGGLIPLLPYFFTPKAATGLLYSCLLTAAVLLVFGAVKTHVTGGTGGFKGYAWGAVSTLAVGGTAAGAAWGVVKALEG